MQGQWEDGQKLECVLSLECVPYFECVLSGLCRGSRIDDVRGLELRNVVTWARAQKLFSLLRAKRNHV